MVCICIFTFIAMLGAIRRAGVVKEELEAQLPDSTPLRTWAMLPGAPLHVSSSSTVRAEAAAAGVVLTTIRLST